MKLQFPSHDELLLQRIDDLDDFTRNILHLASVLGQSFTLLEIIGISEHVLSINADQKQTHAQKLRASLDMAVEEGILDESVPGQDGSGELQHTSFVNFSDFRPEDVDEDDDDGDDEYEEFEEEEKDIKEQDRFYKFCHDAWREKILSYLLESYKRDIHEHATRVLELKFPDIETRDYRTKLKLFYHLKGCGNGSILKAAELAINIGHSLRQQGMLSQSILVYNEALEMFFRKSRRKSNSSEIDGSNVHVGISQEQIEAIDKSHVNAVTKLLTGVAYLSFKLGRDEYSHEIINIILEKMMPRTNSRNIDNSLLLIYPILWILKEERMSKKASLVLEEFVLEPSQRYSGGLARLISSQSFLLASVYKPLGVLFNILMYLEGEVKSLDGDLLLWALDPDSFKFTESVDETLATNGRCASSVGAEICLLLVQNHHNLDKKKKKFLVEKGWGMAQKALKRAREFGYYETPYLQTKPVYDQLYHEVRKV